MGRMKPYQTVKTTPATGKYQRQGRPTQSQQIKRDYFFT